MVFQLTHGETTPDIPKPMRRSIQTPKAVGFPHRLSSSSPSSVLAQSLMILLQLTKHESGHWNPMSPVDLILWTDEYTLKWKLLN